MPINMETMLEEILEARRVINPYFQLMEVFFQVGNTLLIPLTDGHNRKKTTKKKLVLFCQ